MGRQRVVDILCRRDGITYKEACKKIDYCLACMEECTYDPSECEDIMADILGLEPDYIFDLLM